MPGISSVEAGQRLQARSCCRCVPGFLKGTAIVGGKFSCMRHRSTGLSCRCGVLYSHAGPCCLQEGCRTHLLLTMPLHRCCVSRLEVHCSVLGTCPVSRCWHGGQLDHATGPSRKGLTLKPGQSLSWSLPGPSPAHTAGISLMSGRLLCFHLHNAQEIILVSHRALLPAGRAAHIHCPGSERLWCHIGSCCLQGGQLTPIDLVVEDSGVT